MRLVSEVPDAEQEVCLVREDGAAAKAWNSTGMKLSRAAWSVGVLSLLFAGSAAGLMLRRSGRSVEIVLIVGAKNEFLQADEFPTCEMYFAVGKDCQKKNLWECVGDDGSQAFRCCCTTGYGDFSGLTGELVFDDWREDATEMCADLSMPYVGTGSNFDTSILQLGECAVGDGHPGNPYKMFKFPDSGVGMIKWSTHPSKCLCINGAAYDGQPVNLCPCNDGINQHFEVAHGHAADDSHQVRYKGDESYCFNVAGGESSTGTAIQLFSCNATWGSQKFHIKRPQKDEHDDQPKLFCLSLMMSFGYEVDMIKSHLKEGVGIFDCRDYAVYSNVSIQLNGPDADNFSTDVMEGSLAVEFGGKWHTALNTPVFIRFWDKVLNDPKAKTNDWIVKVDPDAVFLPVRLREVLRHKFPENLGNAKAPLFLNNCYLGMHGPIEVLSRQALDLYRTKKHECQDSDNNVSKIQQEDFYFRKCWEYVGIQKENVYNILFENEYACNERPVTRDGRHPCFSRQISIHPFKTVEGYFSCYKRAMSQYFSEPMNIYSEIPSHDNFHHA